MVYYVSVVLYYLYYNYCIAVGLPLGPIVCYVRVVSLLVFYCIMALAQPL